MREGRPLPRERSWHAKKGPYRPAELSFLRPSAYRTGDFFRTSAAGSHEPICPLDSALYRGASPPADHPGGGGLRGRRLRRASILFEPFGLPGWTVRLVTLLLALGFPLALILAWAYNEPEETLSGETLSGEVPGGSPLTSNGLIAGLLVVIAGLLLYPRVFSAGEATSEETSEGRADTAQIGRRSIAVLPFEPLSSGEESETFARGVHDDLLTRLSNVLDLKVISRTSVQNRGLRGLL